MITKEGGPAIISFRSYLDERQKEASRQWRANLRQLIRANRLTRAERLIIVLHYYEEMTIKEIAATLDLSESRVSQMLNHLKSEM
jgi:RNA polymerase sigma factor for flagellar operon FliA